MPGRAGRSLSGIGALAIGGLILASCSLAVPHPTAAPRPTPLVDVSALGARLRPLDRCMLDTGARPVKLREPGDPLAAQNLVVEWVTDGTSPDTMAARLECRHRFAPYRMKTEAEIREIYARWVDEWECLVSLGYHPAEPPSVETFVADWTTGPWDPITGLRTISWSDAQYREAKDRCTLEMYDRD